MENDDMLDATRWTISPDNDINIQRVSFSQDNGMTWQIIPANAFIVDGSSLDLMVTEEITMPAVELFRELRKEVSITFEITAADFRKLWNVLRDRLPARKRHYMRRMARRSGQPWEHIK